jgi:TRAP-type mannitol/chloroaromatic compound transport system permease large subunit
VTLWGIWWYVVIHPLADVTPPTLPVATTAAQPAPETPAPAQDASAEEKPQELGGESADTATPEAAKEPEGVQEMGNPELARQGSSAPSEEGPPPEFFTYFWIIVAATVLALLWYYAKLHAEQFELLKLLSSSVMPLGILTFVVLAVILFGITTATESAAIGAAGAFLMGVQAKTLNRERIKQSVFLTARPRRWCAGCSSDRRCSPEFRDPRRSALVEQWVLSFNLSPLQFMIVSQAIIFVLGWPLEWTEIIVIFVPIFLPLLKHFNIDPILWGTLVSSTCRRRSSRRPSPCRPSTSRACRRRT